MDLQPIARKPNRKIVAKHKLVLHLSFLMTPENIDKFQEDAKIYINNYCNQLLELIEDHKDNIPFPDFIDVHMERTQD